MNLITLLFRRFAKKKKKQKNFSIKKVALKKNRHLSAGIPSVITDLYNASKPGAKKMEFPFKDIPTIKTEIALEAGTKKTLVTVVSILSAGIVTSSIIKAVNKIN